MFLDELTEFCDATALNTGGAASYLIGDVIDTGGDGINDVDGLYLVIQIEAQATSADSTATVAFHLCSDAQDAIAVNGTATYHHSTGATVVTALAPGTYVTRVAMPKGQYERYIGILQTTAVQAVSGGTVNAFLTPAVETYKAFPQAAGAAIGM